jgi:hypothetical protein
MEDVEGTERAADVVEVTVAGTSSEEVDAVEDTVRSAFMSTSATGLMGGKAGKAVGPTFEQAWFACTNMDESKLTEARRGLCWRLCSRLRLLGCLGAGMFGR